MKKGLHLMCFVIFYLSCHLATAQKIDHLIKKRQLIAYFNTFYTTEDLEKIILKLKNDKLSDTVAKNNIGFEVLATTNYIWRDLVSGYPAIQSNTNYAFGKSGFSINIWSSFGADYDTNDLEISSALNYNYAISKRVTTSLGVVYYYAPAIAGLRNSNFGEVYTGIALPSTFLQPNITVFVSDSGSFYTSLALQKQLYSWKKNSMAITGSLAHRFNNTKETNGWRDFNLGVSTSFTRNTLTISIFLRTTRIIEQNTNHIQAGMNFILK
ncbi:hypothetical protein Q4Q35_11870 [Flavivirga aquimarina]|uniref:Uncharacterized protein n=1 Tax=Flavivirga aquimarina TaxID=2027862 RepID=A0ABT8WBI1_9FLAO|nr:hypothetical protein [Flavivirga aquimarina]MDO5970504.1 hypothetical protein [Flavivirga aquimarina]